MKNDEFQQELIDRRAMGKAVSESLWGIYHKRPDRPRLIFPSRRSGTLRVSEQESKILITQWLETQGHWYSIETPTTEQYSQSGANALSARIDVTLHGESEDSDRRVNIELKSGTATSESFRKDFEKLLRENVAGVWFHTLERANRSTWRTVEAKISEAFDGERANVVRMSHTVVFSFCVLDPPQLVTFDLDFSKDFDEQWPGLFRRAVDHPELPGWWRNSSVTPVTERPKDSVRRTFGGATRKLMVYCPEIYPESFVHLSIKGESYRIRAYTGPKRFKTWKQTGTPTTSELLSEHRFVHELDVSRERENLASEREYWVRRTIELNRQHSIETSS